MRLPKTETTPIILSSWINCERVKKFYLVLVTWTWADPELFNVVEVEVDAKLDNQEKLFLALGYLSKV